MRKISLILILCLAAAGPCFAQNNMEGMRILTVNALMQYGQKLYDRGDFNEACAVFNHVLTYDEHQAQALQYLKEMGHPYVTVAPQPQAPQSSIIDVQDNETLKEAIVAKKQYIEKLRSQIIQMQTNIASQSAEE